MRQLSARVARVPVQHHKAALWLGMSWSGGGFPTVSRCLAAVSRGPTLFPARPSGRCAVDDSTDCSFLWVLDYVFGSGIWRSLLQLTHTLSG